MRSLSLAPVLKTKPLQFVLALAVAFISLFTIAGLTPQHASAACGGNNDIICGGVTSKQDFINNVKNSSELQHIYAEYGLSKGSYDDFLSSAQHGYTTRGGSVFLDSGRLVGTNANSIGRNASLQGSGYFTKKISGAGTYYGNVNSKAFAAGTNQLSVYVLLDSDGKAIFTVITSCGNPVGFTPTPPPAKPAPPKPTPPPAPKPSYSCDQLTGVLTNSSNNTYTFTVTGSYANGATPSSAVFNFGDKQTKTVTMTGKTASTTHAYSTGSASSAGYTAYATLYFNGTTYKATSSKCQVAIKATIPYCQALTGTLNGNSKTEYTLTATAVPNGRKLTSATFIYGDGKTETVQPTTPTTAVVVHNYPSGTFSTIATLRFTGTNGTITAPNCLAKVTGTVITPECKPGIPVGDVRCNPCQTNPNVPADSDQCQVTPPELPNTGAGNTIAIFSAVVIAGFLAYRHVLYRQHKRAFLAAEQGTSPLPLADAMSDNPLADTPLAVRAKRTFRRKRQY